jgi:hypothetical protein
VRGLLAAFAGIHLDLYLTGYRSVPTIGWLFLLQVIAGLPWGPWCWPAHLVSQTVAAGHVGGHLDRFDLNRSGQPPVVGRKAVCRRRGGNSEHAVFSVSFGTSVQTEGSGK